MKRIIDFLAATLLIVASAPLMTLLVIAVKLSSPGPALFAHKRVGKDRRVFLCKKLRTMGRLSWTAVFLFSGGREK